MTQRVARPMKFAAFISIIISVAVMLAACQGAVGKAGDGGATGPTGPSGPSGPPGRDGTSPLHLIGVTGLNLTAIETVDNGVDADNMVTVGMPITVDLATYHSAGQGTITYGKPVSSITTDTDQVFVPELTGSMLKLTPKETPPTEAFVIETFTVTIKDSDASGKVITETSLAVRVRRNQKPGGSDDIVSDQKVGSQAPATAPTEMSACTGAGVRPDCYVAVTFTDEDSPAGMEVLRFVATVAADDADKVEVVSYDADPGNPLTARVVVRGLKTTRDEDGDDAPATVTITAMDAGGLTAERTAEVSVDEAPRAKGTMPTRTMKQSATGDAQILVRAVGAFFEDPEGQTMEYSVAPLTGNQYANASIANEVLTVVPNAIGSTEITVTATEQAGLMQTATQTFTVRVVE